MQDKNDQMNRVLNTLRSQEWTGEPYNIQLEERLMKQFSGNKRQSGWHRHRTALLAVCVLAVSSAGFAAAGGVAGLKNWLIKVNVNGQVTEVQTDENGEANFTVETDDGPAQVSVKTWGDGAGEKGARVEISKSDDALEHKQVVEKVVRQGDGPVNCGPLSLDVIGNAQPLASWPSGAGDQHKLYIIAGPEGSGSDILMARYPAQGEAEVYRIGALPAEMLAGSTPHVEVGADGLVTITLGEGTDNHNVMKFKALISDSEMPAPANIDLGGELGSVKVEVQEDNSEE